MKLKNIKDVGRFKNPETGNAVNVKQGRQVGRSVDVLFYTAKGQRVFISDADFYGSWKKNEIIGATGLDPCAKLKAVSFYANCAHCAEDLATPNDSFIWTADDIAAVKERIECPACGKYSRFGVSVKL